jgi:hypothetical protein
MAAGDRASRTSSRAADRGQLAEPGDSGGEGLRSVCIREVQKDLAQSSKLLLETKLSDFRLARRTASRFTGT